RSARAGRPARPRRPRGRRRPAPRPTRNASPARELKAPGSYVRVDQLHVVAELVEAEPLVELLRPVLVVGDQADELGAAAAGLGDRVEDDGGRVAAAAVLVQGAHVLDLRPGLVVIDVGVADGLTVDHDREEADGHALGDAVLAGEELVHHLLFRPGLAAHHLLARRPQRLLLDLDYLDR